jgi:hypothetical protein
MQVTGSLDGKVRVWDNDLVLLKQFEASPLGITSVATNGYGVLSDLHFSLFVDFQMSLAVPWMEKLKSGKLKVETINKN